MENSKYLLFGRVGERLKSLRTKRQITTEDLARRAGVDRTYITKIEKQNILPSPLIMEKIAEALGDEILFKMYLKKKYPTIFKKINSLDELIDEEMHYLADAKPGENGSLRDADWEVRWKKLYTLVTQATLKLRKIAENLEEAEKFDF